jgi:hypothetical protein
MAQVDKLLFREWGLRGKLFLARNVSLSKKNFDFQKRKKKSGLLTFYLVSRKDDCCGLGPIL